MNSVSQQHLERFQIPQRVNTRSSKSERQQSISSPRCSKCDTLLLKTMKIREKTLWHVVHRFRSDGGDHPSLLHRVAPKTITCTSAICVTYGIIVRSLCLDKRLRAVLIKNRGMYSVGLSTNAYDGSKWRIDRSFVPLHDCFIRLRNCETPLDRMLFLWYFIQSSVDGKIALFFLNCKKSAVSITIRIFLPSRFFKVKKTIEAEFTAMPTRKSDPCAS